MPNVLPWESRVRIVSALVEGNSLRATSRMTNTDKNTTRDFGLRVGEGCAYLHNRIVRGVAAHMLECDERWSFIHTKEARVDPSKHPAEWGDVYTFVALDAVTKLVVAYHVGKRDEQAADAFIADLRSRLTAVPHLATDGFAPYIAAIRTWFLGSADYGQVVKNYRAGSKRGPDHRYEPPRDPFISKMPIIGAPNMEKLCTSHIERQKLTMRHIVGRTRRLCLAFSKTLRGHRAAEALGFMAYNFVRIHAAIGCTPAMAAGLADHPWTVGELMDAALAAEPSEAPRPARLALRPGTSEAARELPAGRGWLRVVSGGKGAPAVPSPIPVGAPASPGTSYAPSRAPGSARRLCRAVRRPVGPARPALVASASGQADAAARQSAFPVRHRLAFRRADVAQWLTEAVRNRLVFQPSG
jgi:IS1 family transposase